jgi:hypothetical protein
MMATSSHVFSSISREGTQWVYGGRLFVVSARTNKRHHVLTKAPERQSLQLRCTLGAIRPEIRYAKWARGLSLADTQTGRYGRLYSRRRLCARLGADTHDPSPLDPRCTSCSKRLFAPIILSSIPIPVPGQYRLSRCLE